LSFWSNLNSQKVCCPKAYLYVNLSPSALLRTGDYSHPAIDLGMVTLPVVILVGLATLALRRIID
jgi:hypothetical protein